MLPKVLEDIKFNYLTYRSAMQLLGVSRRTLQRWMDDMLVEPLSFEGTKLMFLTRIHMEKLLRYRQIMNSGDAVLIRRFREAVSLDDGEEALRLLKQLETRL